VDVTLRIEDRFPLRVSAGYEDTGNQFVGDHRWVAGASWGNAWGLDHQINYQYYTDVDFDHYEAHVVSYLAPLPWRHSLTLFGTYSEVEADLGSFPGFTQDGNNYQGSLRYTVPLPAYQRYNHEITAGFDFKRTENNIEFGAVPVFNTPTEVAQFVLSYRGLLPDRYGSTGFGLLGYYSPGGLTDRNDDLSFALTRPGAESEYAYGRLAAERVTKLPLTPWFGPGWDSRARAPEQTFSWHVRASCQFASSNLLPSEQLGLGGYATVRGYAERLVNGDEGVVINNELRSPVFRIGNLLNRRGGGDTIQFLVFVDYGSTSLKDPGPGEDSHHDLASVGGGLRYQMSDNVSLRFDYGYQLKEKNLESQTGFKPEDGRAHIAFYASF
jgi:hemolysin activation/secretion protein